MKKHRNRKTNGNGNGNGHGQGNGNGRTSPTVCLEFTHPTATSVCVAGTFNDWRPGATLMVPVGEGHWRKELVLPPGTYEYLLVADSHWMTDPLAKETIPNPFGGANCVLRVPAASGKG